MQRFAQIGTQIGPQGTKLSNERAVVLFCLAAGPGEGGEVDVSAGENHAEFGRAAVGTIRKVQGRNNAGFQERRYGDGAGRFDDDFHTFPNEAGGGDDFFFGDQKNAIDIFSKNRESARGEGSAQAVSDGVAGIERLQSSGGEGAVGVVGARGLAAKDSNGRSNASGAEARSAQQTAAADWCKDGVQIAHFFEQFLCGGGLASDDAIVVVRMNEMRASFSLHARGDLGARGNGWLAECDLAAVGFDGLDFHFRGVFRHDNVGGDAAPGGGASDRGAVVSAGGSDDAVRGLFVRKRKNRICRPANFEGAGLLQVFTFEEEFRAGDGVQRRRGENRGAMDPWRDTRVSGEDGLPTRRLIHGAFDLWCHAHERIMA